jgi:SAM-dependent methyltransferase
MSDVQVPPEHYSFESYDNKWRWMSYWYQIRTALAVSPRSVLEIGSGTGTFRAYLQARGIDVRSADIDDSRQPDYVADVSRLDQTLPPGVTFDLVAACQVLEHLPYDRFEPALEGIAKRADPYALITLPYRGWRFTAALGFNNWNFVVGGRLPKFRPLKFNGQHYWELGWKHPAWKITRVMEQYFEVLERYTIKENAYHYLWLLRSKLSGD